MITEHKQSLPQEHGTNTLLHGTDQTKRTALRVCAFQGSGTLEDEASVCQRMIGKFRQRSLERCSHVRPLLLVPLRGFPLRVRFAA